MSEVGRYASYRIPSGLPTIPRTNTFLVQLYGDERMVEVPLGFSHRLHRRLEENMPGNRRGFLGWMVAATAAVLVAGSFEVARSSVSSPTLRSDHAQPGTGVPPDMMVVVSAEGKTFHAVGCPFIHDKAHTRTIHAGEALREGYAPCVRCMKKYLNS
jgi:hypothetical protein